MLPNSVGGAARTGVFLATSFRIVFAFLTVLLRLAPSLLCTRVYGVVGPEITAILVHALATGKHPCFIKRPGAMSGPDLLSND
jgi:hypothetical protein